MTLSKGHDKFIILSISTYFKFSGVKLFTYDIKVVLHLQQSDLKNKKRWDMLKYLSKIHALNFEIVAVTRSCIRFLSFR